MNIKITPEKELFILNNLKISNKILAEKVGVNEVTIEKFLRKRGLKKGRRLINVDESFFEKIDSHQKAYVLGLIYADGWNNVSGNKWGIQLTEGDGYLLEKIASLIKYEGSIKILIPNCFSVKVWICQL
jgi:hypothetical protein